MRAVESSNALRGLWPFRKHSRDHDQIVPLKTEAPLIRVFFTNETSNITSSRRVRGRRLWSADAARLEKTRGRAPMAACNATTKRLRSGDDSHQQQQRRVREAAETEAACFACFKSHTNGGHEALVSVSHRLQLALEALPLGELATCAAAIGAHARALLYRERAVRSQRVSRQWLDLDSFFSSDLNSFSRRGLEQVKKGEDEIYRELVYKRTRAHWFF